MSISAVSRNHAFQFSISSSSFWLCNTIGWLAFDFAQGCRNSFDGSSLTENLISYLPTSILGMIGGLCVHFIYYQLHWYRKHPIHLIPAAAWIAIIFGAINSTIHHFDLVVSIPEICSRQYPRPPFSCGLISDLFLQSMGSMLIWCLLYFLIQAENKTHEKVSANLFLASKALFYLLVLNHLGTFLSVIAYVDWGETHYLFSKDYFIGMLGQLIPVFSAAYILFIKPERQLCGSTTLALLPIIIGISFCCTTLNIGTGSVIFRLTQFQNNFDLYYVLFGASYGNGINAALLAGMLDGGFVSAMSITLFFLIYRHTSKWTANEDHLLAEISVKKTLSMWGYYFIFWLFFGLLLYATDLMDWAYFGANIPFINTISFIIVGLFVGAGLRLQVLYFATKHVSTFNLVLKIVVASIFFGMLLASSIWLINYAYILVVLNGHEIDKYASFVSADNYIFASILSACILCGLWSFICYMIEALHLHRDFTIKQLQLEMNMKEVQLNALAGKVDPHFIFNALNNIRALVNEDSEKARSAIAVLSDILRNPITTNAQDKILVEEEMQLVRNYVSLSKIQYENRLIYLEKIDEDVNSALIPSMMLQILVENAIKHGISQLPDGGVLSLQIQKREQQLVCEVANHGSLPSHSKTLGFGVGIKAIRERLMLLYGNYANFSLQEVNDTVVAKLILPLENSL